MTYELKTRHGYNMYDISSLLQKSIRRADIDRAAFAASELYDRFRKYMWKRLLVISAEDCYGIMTKEIIGLKLADDEVNGTRKLDGDPVFAAKAIVLLCMARKNRDGCYVGCVFMHPDRNLDPKEIPHVDIRKAQLEDDELPDWVFDVHTLKGKRMGRTGLDMTIAEQEALEPKQLSLFDMAGWNDDYQRMRDTGKIRSEREWQRIVNFMHGKENDPTHRGEDWPEHEVNWGNDIKPKSLEMEYGSE